MHCFLSFCTNLTFRKFLPPESNKAWTWPLFISSWLGIIENSNDWNSCFSAKVGQEIEIRPGIISKDNDGRLRCQPIFSKIVSLYTEHNDLQYAAPGGLIGVGTKIDPTLCRADRMVGQVLGAVEALPNIFTELEINYFLLRRLLGVKTEGDKKGAKVLNFCVKKLLILVLYVATYILYLKLNWYILDD